MDRVKLEQKLASVKAALDNYVAQINALQGRKATLEELIAEEDALTVAQVQDPHLSSNVVDLLSKLGG